MCEYNFHSPGTKCAYLMVTFIRSCINSLSNYLLSTYHVPAIILGAEATALSKTDQGLALKVPLWIFFSMNKMCLISWYFYFILFV